MVICLQFSMHFIYHIDIIVSLLLNLFHCLILNSFIETCSITNFIVVSDCYSATFQTLWNADNIAFYSSLSCFLFPFKFPNISLKIFRKKECAYFIFKWQFIFENVVISDASSFLLEAFSSTNFILCIWVVGLNIL